MVLPAGGSRLVAELADAERGERTRLAERLHDDGLQLVLAARQDLVELLEGDAAAAALLSENLDHTVETLRSITSAMHEDLLDVLTLEEALQRVGEDAARRGRFALEVHCDPAASTVHDALVRDIVRELLANVARHARADRAVVEVRVDGANLVIEVSDDGLGLDPLARNEAARSGHLGLPRIERTAAELGGSLGIAESSAEGGTRVTVWLPLGSMAAQGTLEDALRGERRWAAAMLAALQDGLIVFRGGAVIQVNDAFCTMTGFDRSQLIGATPDNYPFWTDEARPALWADLAPIHRAGGRQEVVELLTARGTTFPAACFSARLDDPAGGEVAMLVTVKDVSEDRRREDSRRLELELATTIETARRLTSMLEAIEDGTEAVLERLGRLLVDHLGWAGVTICLRRSTNDPWRTAWATERDAPADAGEGWAALLGPRPPLRGAHLVEGRTAPGASHDAWRSDDLLLVPMRTAAGAIEGILAVERPRAGLRPSATELDALVAVAEHASRVLDRARIEAPPA